MSTVQFISDKTRSKEHGECPCQREYWLVKEMAMEVVNRLRARVSRPPPFRLSVYRAIFRRPGNLCLYQHVSLTSLQLDTDILFSSFI
jgi:hypothetical protein